MVKNALLPAQAQLPFGQLFQFGLEFVVRLGGHQPGQFVADGAEAAGWVAGVSRTAAGDLYCQLRLSSPSASLVSSVSNLLSGSVATSRASSSPMALKRLDGWQA
ncbi:hypothetical protein PVT67_03235 [Gallaecimonas kandeliae]|uniref:hypothetical protein n=1 Tax=Gallaecimonas kandeliae TaxID=3029055 RepID=UPI002649DFFF|nr:hypothetical protein [Gallaecimonas kandeliae]WKE66278.1 hypothetical protein PVT67_03235 [Gallaecimonas kandeliae]